MPAPIAITHVTIIDTQGGSAQPDTTVRSKINDRRYGDSIANRRSSIRWAMAGFAIADLSPPHRFEIKDSQLRFGALDSNHQRAARPREPRLDGIELWSGGVHLRGPAQEAALTGVAFRSLHLA